LIGGIALTLATHGTDQFLVQRLLSARSAREASAGLVLSGLIVFTQFALFLVIGIALFTFYQHEPLPVRAEWEAKTALRSCDLFLAVGTSGSVSPASNFVRSAEYAGARTIYINLEPMDPPNRAFAEVHLGRAEDLLPVLLGAR